jgi:hypothetical protein
MTAPGGLVFTDDAGSRFALALSSGLDVDFGERVGELVEQLHAMFTGSRFAATLAAAAPPSSRPLSAASRAAPAAADELDILARVGRIAAASARNANLLGEFEAAEAAAAEGRAAARAGIGGQLLGRVESLFAAAPPPPAFASGESAALGVELLEMEGSEVDEAAGYLFDAPPPPLPPPPPRGHFPGTAPTPVAAPAKSVPASARGMRSNIEAFLTQAYDA